MTKLHILKATTALISAAVLVGCGGQSSTGDKSASGEMRALGTVDPQIWPKVESPVGLDADMEARITDLLSQMTLRQKVGQMVIIAPQHLLGLSLQMSFGTQLKQLT